MNGLQGDMGFLHRVSPIEITILVNTGRKLVRVINMSQAESDAETEMVLGDGFVAQETAETHVGVLPPALQMTGIGGGTPGHIVNLSMMGYFESA